MLNPLFAFMVVVYAPFQPVGNGAWAKTLPSGYVEVWYPNDYEGGWTVQDIEP